MIKGSQIQDLHYGEHGMLTYLLVKGLGSAHYPVFGGSNPPVSVGEYGITNVSYSKKSIIF